MGTIRTSVIAGAVLFGMTAVPAAAADKVPVKLKVKGCDGCSVMATWNSTGTAKGKIGSKTKKVRGTKDTLTFKVRKNYYLYFTAVSGDPDVMRDAATVLVTQFKGQKKGDKVSASQVQTLDKGAYYCMKVKKPRTVKAQAAVFPADGGSLLAFWANPQLGATGNKIKDGIDGVYGTQNTLICKGKF
ncbi:MAG: hypothetical protein R2720_03505 [Candidatus Nanopelagicales bacterium]